MTTTFRFSIAGASLPHRAETLSLSNPIFRLRSRCAGLFLLVLLLAGPATAQVLPYGVDALSAGGGGPSFVRDTDALFLNPANLVYADRGGNVVISLFPVRMSGGGDLVQFGFYNEGLTGGALSEERKHEIVEGWFGPSERNALRRAGVSAGVVPLALTVRGRNWAVGLGAQLRSHNRFGVNRGLLELALFGTEEERSVPLDAEVRSMNYATVSVAYSRRLPERRIAIGIAPKLVLGMSYADGRMNSTLDISEEAIVHRFDYVMQAAGSFSRDVFDRFELLGAENPVQTGFQNPFGSVAGTGAGIDLGITYEMRPNVHVAASVTDLGYVRWNRDAERITPVHSEFRFEGLDLDTDRINAEFDGSIGRYFSHVLDSLANNAYGEVAREQASFSTATPAALHAGGTWYFNNQLGAISAGTTVPLNTAPGNMTRRPAVYLGAEYRIGRRFGVPVRAGLRAGGTGALSASFGLGLHTPIWDFAVSAAATPHSELMGGGMHVTVGVSVMTLRFGSRKS